MMKKCLGSSPTALKSSLYLCTPSYLEDWVGGGMCLSSIQEHLISFCMYLWWWRAISARVHLGRNIKNVHFKLWLSISPPCLFIFQGGQSLFSAGGPKGNIICSWLWSLTTLMWWLLSHCGPFRNPLLRPGVSHLVLFVWMFISFPRCLCPFSPFLPQLPQSRLLLTLAGLGNTPLLTGPSTIAFRMSTQSHAS